MGKERSKLQLLVLRNEKERGKVEGVSRKHLWFAGGEPVGERGAVVMAMVTVAING